MLDIHHQKGLLTELACATDFTRLGYRVLKSLDDSAKYDYVVDINGRFIRVQCKSASWATDTADPNVAFRIDTCCQTTNTKENTRHKYGIDEIDYFYTYFEGQGYLVSITEASGTSFRFRYNYPPTGQKKGIHLADDYKIEEVIKTI